MLVVGLDGGADALAEEMREERKEAKQPYLYWQASLHAEMYHVRVVRSNKLPYEP